MKKDKILIELLEQRLMLSASINDHDTVQEKEVLNEEEKENIHSNELIVIDSSVQDYQNLLSLLPADAIILFVEENENGIQKITEFLSDHNDLSAIHIVSHGDNAEFLLGNEELNKNTINNYKEQLSSWAKSFTEDADFFIYGCNLASDETGENFVKTLASLTSLDISVSDDLTGSEKLGGDWELEFSVGKIERKSLIIEDFEGVLLAEKGFFGTNLKLWLDSRDTNADGVIDADTDSLSTWKDKSGTKDDFTVLGTPTRLVGGGINFSFGNAYKYSGDKADFDFLSTSNNNSIFLVIKDTLGTIITTNSSDSNNGGFIYSSDWR